MVIESVVMTLFVAAAVAGFTSSAWIVVVALAGHGVFDAVHGHVVENAGVPALVAGLVSRACDARAAARLRLAPDARHTTATRRRTCSMNTLSTAMSQYRRRRGARLRRCLRRLAPREGRRDGDVYGVSTPHAEGRCVSGKRFCTLTTGRPIFFSSWRWRHRHRRQQSSSRYERLLYRPGIATFAISRL
ncbi:MAG: hypothetical protein MZV63_23650 [Marinilabiliales bacterium]|nr:hypothetical protein [Marinilabiliales bacterium]